MEPGRRILMRDWRIFVKWIKQSYFNCDEIVLDTSNCPGMNFRDGHDGLFICQHGDAWLWQGYEMKNGATCATIKICKVTENEEWSVGDRII